MFTANRIAKTFVASTVLALFAAASTGAMAAESHWDKTHPARDQVNDRLHNQNVRINNEFREGEISRNEARRLHREDRQIRSEERMMASQHRGHISRLEDQVLNQQENLVSRQIGK